MRSDNNWRKKESGKIVSKALPGHGREEAPVRVEKELPYPSPRTLYLYPGAICVPDSPHIVTTVLGSCVAVCLWDPGTESGAINHYLLPSWNGEGAPTPRYGDIAINALIKRMLELGCRRRDIRAKIFGGASMWETAPGHAGVGDQNIILARKLLKESGIPIVKSDTGGTRGRKIIFDTRGGTVLLQRHRERPAA